jgi:hypothetical protein
MRDRMLAWAALNSDFGTAITADLGDVGEAAEDLDLDDMETACRRLKTDLSDILDALPTPDPDLTEAMQTSYDHFLASAVACIDGTSNVDVDALELSAAEMQLGGASMKRATAIVQSYS